MRSLNTIVLGFTSLFAAAAFAQVPNTGSQDRPFVQAQAGGPMGSQGQMNGQGQTDPRGSVGTDRMNEGKSSDPMTSPMTSGKDKGKDGYHAPVRNTRQDPARDDSSQARKGKKQESKDTGGE